MSFENVNCHYPACISEAPLLRPESLGLLPPHDVEHVRHDNLRPARMADMGAVAGDLVAFSVSPLMDVCMELLHTDRDVPGTEGLHPDSVDYVLRDQISVAALKQPLQTDASVGSQVRLGAARCDSNAAVPEGSYIGAQKVPRGNAKLLLYGLGEVEHPCNKLSMIREG